MIPAGKEQHENIEELAHEYDRDELRQLDATGNPLHLNHKGERLNIGTVIDCWNSENGDKLFLAKLDTSTLRGEYTKNAILSNIYRDVSYQHVFSVACSEQEGAIYSSKRGIELSVCEKGRRPGTHIYYLVPMKQHPKTPRVLYKSASAASSDYSTACSQKSMEGGGEKPSNTSEKDVAPPASAKPSEKVDFTKFDPAEHARHTVELREKLAEREREMEKLKKQFEAADQERKAMLEERQKKQLEKQEKEKQKAMSLWEAAVTKFGNDFGEDFVKQDDRAEAIRANIEKNPSQWHDIIEVASAASDGYREQIKAQNEKLRLLDEQLREARLKGYSQRYNELSGTASPPDNFASPEKRFQPATDPSESQQNTKRAKLSVPAFVGGQQRQNTSTVPEPTQDFAPGAHPTQNTPVASGVSSASSKSTDDVLQELFGSAPRTYSQAEIRSVYGFKK